MLARLRKPRADRLTWLIRALAASMRALKMRVRTAVPISVMPAAQRAGQDGELGRGAEVSAPGDRFVEMLLRVEGIVGAEHVADGFFGDPALADLDCGVGCVERCEHLVQPGGVEPFGAGEQQLASMAERVAFAASVPGGLVLDASAGAVERLSSRGARSRTRRLRSSRCRSGACRSVHV